MTRSATLAAALLTAGSIPGCGPGGQCLSTCFDTSMLRFEPPISQPGAYVLELGPARCSADLPAQSGLCEQPGAGLELQGFAIAGYRGTSPLTQTLAVRIERDGSPVLETTIIADEREDVESCTRRCKRATYTVAVPEQLVRPAWGPCEPAWIEGDYAVVEQRLDGDCPELDADDVVRLAVGVPVLGDSGCGGELTAFSAAGCTLSASAGCTAPPLDTGWQLELTDVIGDGSRLLGRATLEIRAPIACSGAFQVDLRRRD